MVPQRAQLLSTDTTLLPTSTLPLLGDQVALRLLQLLVQGELRFGELRVATGASTKTVSDRLKRMEKEGWLTRTLYASVPPKAVYRLTEKGQELVAIVNRIADWEQSWQNAV